MVRETASGRLACPVPVTRFPFVATIDLEETSHAPSEPSPCLPTARASWYALHPALGGRVAVDLAGSTPLDPVVRLFRLGGSDPATLVFLGCASPLWNAQLSLSTSVVAGDVVLAQVGTSESVIGTLVMRVALDG